MDRFLVEGKVSFFSLIVVLEVIAFAALTANAAWYQGCFEENVQARSFNISAGNYKIDDSSNQECTSLCDERGFRFAGTQGHLCFCSQFYNTRASAPTDSLCNTPCAALNACGNTSYIRVYETQDSLSGLKVFGPEIGWLMESVNFTSTVAKGGANASYTYDFGDGSFILTTCPNATHIYKRGGIFQVKVSARTNISGPIFNTTWVSIQSAVGLIQIQGPTSVVKAGEPARFDVGVGQGTNMSVQWMFDDGRSEAQEIPDSFVNLVGSTATYGNASGSPEKGGTYVIPSSVINRDGYLLAWELYASKAGTVRLQIFRPRCAAVGDHFCPWSRSCIALSQACPNSSLFSCPNGSFCPRTGHCLPGCSPHNSSHPGLNGSDYLVVTETLVDILAVGSNVFPLQPKKAIFVQAGDVIGWTGNTTRGDLAFENSASEPTFFFSAASFKNTAGALLSRGSATSHLITPILRAYVSQISQGSVEHTFKRDGNYNVSAHVKNEQNSALGNFSVIVQEPIEYVRIVSPKNVTEGINYGVSTKVWLKKEVGAGTSPVFTWESSGNMLRYNFTIFNSTGLHTITLTAHNNVSKVSNSTTVSVLEPVGALKWMIQPLSTIDVGRILNLTFQVESGMRIDVTVQYGDGKSIRTYLERAKNTNISLNHTYSTGGTMDIKVTADNNIEGNLKTLTHQLKVRGKMGDLKIEVRPAFTISDVLDISTGQEFEISVSSSESTFINYTFYFGDREPQKKSPYNGRTKVSHTYEEETSFNVTIQASIGGYSENRTVFVKASRCGPPAIYLYNVYKAEFPMVIARASEILLQPKVHWRSEDGKDNCKFDHLMYEWHISDTSTGKPVVPEVEKNSHKLNIQPRTLEKGTYTINLTIQYLTNRYFFQTYIEVKRSSLVAKILGGSFRTVPYSSTAMLTLNASKSSDPDETEENPKLNFRWQCKSNQKHDPGRICASENLTNIGMHEKLLQLRVSNFTNNVTYVFRVIVVSQHDSTEAMAEQKVLIKSRDSPVMQIRCHENCDNKVNSQERLVLQGVCGNCSTNDLEIRWSVQNESKLEVKVDTTTGLKKEYLVFKSNTLEKDKHYTVILKASTGSSEAIVMYEIQTSSPPYGGTCYAWPGKGTVAETKFHITCEEWLSSDTPLLYEFRYEQNDKNLGSISSLPQSRTQTELWYYGHEQSTPSSVLPIGDKEEQYRVRLMVRIFNRYGYFTKFGLNVTVNPVEIKSYEELAKDSINNLPSDADSQTVLRWANAISSILNENQTTPASQEAKQKPVPGSQILEKVRKTGGKDWCEERKEGGRESMWTFYSEPCSSIPAPEFERRVIHSTKISRRHSQFLLEIQRTSDKRLTEIAEQIRFQVVNEVMQRVKEDLTIEGVEQKASALRKAIESPNEVSSDTQVLAAKGFKESGKYLKELLKKTGATRINEVSQVILTGVSNNLKASSVTTKDFIHLAIENLVPKTGPPLRDWAGRIHSRNSEKDAELAEEVVHTLYGAINEVSEAMQVKTFEGEPATVAITKAFTMELKRANLTSDSRSFDVRRNNNRRIGRFVLPDISDLPDIQKLVGEEKQIMAQVLSFSKNPIRWDEIVSPHVTNDVVGLSLKTGGDNPREITVKDTKDIEIFTPVSFANATHFSKSFRANEFGAIHRYRLTRSTHQDSARFPLLVYVKPEDGQHFTVYFRVSFNVSSEDFDLKFKVPNMESEELPPGFRKVNAYSFIVEDIFTQKDTELYLGMRATQLTEAGHQVTINYTVHLHCVSCVYWTKKYSKAWQLSGCRVGNRTTGNMTQCLCNHLTFFSSMVVKPNPIGPLTIEAFKKGYVLFVAVAIVFLLYFVGLVWARKKDRVDVVKVGACPLQDNDPVDPYRYELTLWTSMRRNAGTSSKVSITLHGEANDSESRVLQDPERSTFQRGSVDTFLLTTPLDLESISYIRIWHDNSGGSWFLSRIMIINLQTDEHYYFICNRWLAVDEDDGQVERVIPLASNVELTEFPHLFMARTRRNLSDNHLWFSVFARPASSRFTRVQRLSCCLCLLLMSMMASAMYYETLQEPTAANSQYIGSFVFTWTQVFIGVVTSLIVFPVNLIIVQIFRSVKPKPHKVQTKPKQNAVNQNLPRLSLTVQNLEDYHRLKDSPEDSNRGSENSLDITQEKNARMRLSINDVHTDVDRMSYSSSPLMIGRSTMEYEENSIFRRIFLCLKTKIQLPYYFIYVAWFLVFAFSVSSALMIIFYGMTFGNGKSLQWLFSSVVSFIQDIIITQPLKVLGMAVFFALVVKKPDKGEFEVTDEALQLAEDEEWLHSVTSKTNAPRKRLQMLPLDRARLLRMRNARMKERKMYAVLREVAFFYLFLCLLLIIAYSHRDPIAFYQTKNFVNTMAGNFTKLTTQKAFWNWTHEELLPTLFPSSWYNGADRKPDGFLADHYSQLVGTARLRLLRAKTEPCVVPTDEHGITEECYGSYFITNEDKRDYTPGWRNITEYEEEIDWDDMPWRHQSYQELDGYPFWARLTTYGGGGYTIILEPGMENHQRLQELQDNFWINRPARAILTEFTIYNAGTNLFTVVTLVSEFPATGGLITYVSLQTAKLYDYTKSYMFFVLSCEIVFLVFILFFFFRECKKMYRSGPSAYFKEFWNCTEFCIVAFTFVAVALYVYRALTIKDVVVRVAKEPFKFKSFQVAAYWNELYTFVVAMIVCFSTIKINKLLRFNRRMSLLSSTLRHAFFPLSMFGVMFGIVICAFTTMATLFFGQNVMGYRNFISSLTSLLSLMLGKTNFVDLKRVNRVTGPLFFFAFMFLVSMVLLNMFLSIIIDSFNVVKHDNDKQSNEYEIVDFILERFKAWSGIGSTHRPRDRKRVLWDTAASKVKAVRAFQPHRLTVDERGFYMDNVSKLEERLDKVFERVESHYEEHIKKNAVPGLQSSVDNMLSSEIDYRMDRKEQIPKKS